MNAQFSEGTNICGGVTASQSSTITTGKRKKKKKVRGNAERFSNQTTHVIHGSQNETNRQKTFIFCFYNSIAYLTTHPYDRIGEGAVHIGSPSPFVHQSVVYKPSINGVFSQNLYPSERELHQPRAGPKS